MKLSLVVAVDLENGIGRNGTIPWHLRSDLQRFKQITMGHAILMGRKTYQSIGRALPGRLNIVVTRNAEFLASGCVIADSIERGLLIASDLGLEQVFIIGGAQIFLKVQKIAQAIHLTVVHTRAGCQVFFPPLNWIEWNVIQQEFVPGDIQNDFSSVYYWLEHVSR